MFQHKISDWWRHIEFVKNPYNHPDMKDCLAWLQKKLSSLEFSSQRDLYEFCAKIGFDVYEDDEPRHEGGLLCDLDDKVITRIDDLATRFGASACGYDYPSAILMHKLYHLAALHGGTKSSVHPKFKEAIIGFLSHRRFLDKCDKSTNDREGIKKEITQEMRIAVNNYLGEIDVIEKQGILVNLDGKAV